MTHKLGRSTRTYQFQSSGQHLISMGVVDHFHHVLMGWISVWALFVTFISLSFGYKSLFSLSVAWSLLISFLNGHRGSEM